MKQMSRLSTASLERTQPSIFDEPIYDNDLHQKFVRWKEKSGTSLRKLAPMLRRSYTSVGNYLNYKYEGDLKDLERDILALLERKEGQGGKVKKERFCQIPVSTMIWEVLQTCHERRKEGSVIGASGTSKTWTALEYQDKNPGTILITASPTRRSLSSILHAILFRVGGGGVNTKLDDILYSVIDRLKSWGRLIILDESNFLKFESFEILRTIYDETQTGFVYLGTPKLYSRMRGDRNYDWDQILSRISIRRAVNEISYEDVKIITSEISPGLAKNCVDFLFQTAQEPGKLRVMVDLLKKAVEFHEVEGATLNLNLFKEIKKLNDF
ncbi:MAG TPA: AAA family ATPase [Desulfatiglandales bacterium]|nr:AAA family ATPase [Desulfatiglandales bacterium]